MSRRQRGSGARRQRILNRGDEPTSASNVSLQYRVGDVMAAKKKAKAPVSRSEKAIETAVERIGDLLSEREDGSSGDWDADVRKILKKLIKAVM